MLSCAMWLLYSLPMVRDDRTLFLICNGIGLLIQIGFLGLYVYYRKANWSKILLLFLLQVAIVAVLSGIILGIVKTPTIKYTTVGLIAVAASLPIQGVYISQMNVVSKSETLEKMPLLPVVFSILSGTCWIASGGIASDYFLLSWRCFTRVKEPMEAESLSHIEMDVFTGLKQIERNLMNIKEIFLKINRIVSINQEKPK